MEELSKVLGGCLSTILLLFASMLLSTVIGAFIGLVVGCFFSDVILGIFASIGITGFKMWEIGAFLGFIGSFFRPAITFRSNQSSQTSINNDENLRP